MLILVANGPNNKTIPAAVTAIKLPIRRAKPNAAGLSQHLLFAIGLLPIIPNIR